MRVDNMRCIADTEDRWAYTEELNSYFSYPKYY